MSWWDSGFSNFANQATQALQKAQQQIDKVLDIKEGDEGSPSVTNQDSSGIKLSNLLLLYFVSSMLLYCANFSLFFITSQITLFP